VSIRNVRVGEIVVDCGTQIRAEINESAVGEYSEAMRDGAEFPPVVVFNDGNRYLCADGFHRTLAAARIGRDAIKAEIRQGTKTDALKFALSANVSHGLRRTNQDKRCSVALALSEWPGVSDRSIAETCAVHHQLVADVRSQLGESSSSPVASRIGADGRTRRLPQRPTNQPTQRAHVGGELYGDANGQTEQEDAPRIVTAGQRGTETDQLPQLLDTLSELVGRAVAELDSAQRWQFADELEASALDLRNQ